MEQQVQQDHKEIRAMLAQLVQVDYLAQQVRLVLSVQLETLVLRELREQQDLQERQDRLAQQEQLVLLAINTQQLLQHL
jgi:hypothetical protein